MEISYSDSKGKECKVKDSEDFEHKAAKAESEVGASQAPLRKESQSSSHPDELIMGDKVEPIRTISSFNSSEEMLIGLVSLIKHTSINEELLDTVWILAMQENLN